MKIIEKMEDLKNRIRKHKVVIFMILFLLFHLSSSPRPSRYKTYSSNIFGACKVGFREI